MPENPAAQYTRRAAERAAESARLDRRSVVLGNLKLAAVIAFFVAGGFYIKQHAFAPYWLLVPVIAFIALTLVHDRAIKAKHCAQKAREFYDRGIARLEDRWVGGGDAGEQFRISDHVYADDLDLFGRGSLFELLCTARTPLGRQTLANWLLAAAPPEEIRARQQSI